MLFLMAECSKLLSAQQNIVQRFYEGKHAKKRCVFYRYIYLHTAAPFIGMHVSSLCRQRVNKLYKRGYARRKAQRAREDAAHVARSANARRKEDDARFQRHHRADARRKKQQLAAGVGVCTFTFALVVTIAHIDAAHDELRGAHHKSCGAYRESCGANRKSCGGQSAGHRVRRRRRSW